MATYSQVRQHSLREILNILGEDAQLGTECHVHYNKEPVIENPFPYPFRGNNSGLLLIRAGKLKIQLNLEVFVVGAGDLVIISSQVITHILEILEPVTIIGLVFTDQYALKNILNYEEVNVLRFFTLNEMPVLSFPESKRAVVLYLLESMHKLNSMHGQESYYSEEKTFHYFNLLALEIIEVYRTEVEKVAMKTSRKKEIIQDFLNLLSLYVRQERSVKFYADKLFITSGHLSKLLKEASGSTARDVIEEAVVMEARNFLMDTSLSLAQIAEELNFSDQSFFGKFFKKKMMLGPKAFRDKYK
ncbi:helix-turn-helix domain-containing protein [Dyadobacter sp. OTU695]|uniref:helix-turn-helix domain-containing protein n=1 Tax=Dyadobacter sp. OTU695 TaxID=3043860 RepID=UPI00313C8287